MEEVKVLLNDGTTLSNNYDAYVYLTSTLGFTSHELEVILTAEDGYRDRLKSTEAAYSEYERLYDGICVDCRNLVDELDDVVERLRSGKSGRGYTKSDLAQQIRRIVSENLDHWL